MAKEIIVTDEGLRKLELELEELKTIKRKEVAEKIKVALSFGDLSENSEYDEAKNEQAFVESRIATLEAMLKVAKVVDESELSTDKVAIGSKVKVLNVTRNTEAVYNIVGSTESDPLKGKISDESPIGKALIGAKAGDVVSVEAPAGTITIEILEINK
ncbi:MAG: transcription elongation factor GreA [Oscillospiraceae bacterium]|nr:transcription elongation factor GreA [Oscillospiraceae bacterium]